MASADIVLALRVTVTSSAISRELKRINHGSNRMEINYGNLFAEAEIEKVQAEVEAIRRDKNYKSDRAAYANLLEQVRFKFSEMLRSTNRGET